MFGVEVLVWTADNIENPSLLAGAARRYFRRPLGHVSIKVVLPDNTETNELIHKYCLSQSKRMLIPHRKVKVKIPVQRMAPESNQPSHDAKSVNGWEFYFSFWPDQVQNELFDRAVQNDSINRDVIFAEPWASQLDIAKKKEPRGFVAYWISESLSDWLFGPRKEISLPIKKITHLPKTEKEARLKKIRNVDAKVKMLEEYENERSVALLRKNICASELMSTERQIRFLERSIVKKLNLLLKPLAYQTDLFELRSNKRVLEALYATYSDAYQHANRKYEQFRAELAIIEDELYHDIVSIGANPTTTVGMPLQCFNLDRMFKAMHMFATHAEHFDLTSNNCSTAAFQVLYSGLDEAFEQWASKAGWLGFWDLWSPFVAIPEHVGELAMKIAKAGMYARQAQAIKAQEEVPAPSTIATPILHQHQQSRLKSNTQEAAPYKSSLRVST